MKQSAHPHAADLGDARGVVAEQVDDHQVLRPLFLTAEEPCYQQGILARGPASSCGALHRAEQQLAIIQLEEELRTGASDLLSASLAIILASSVGSIRLSV
jgi:hypothetical protein